MEISVAKLEALLSVTQVAEMFDVPGRVVRKVAKKGQIPGTIKILGKLGFDPDVVVDWVPPKVSEYGAHGPKREDGRRKYFAYLLPEEVEKLKGEGYEVVDPRVAAKARRAAKKAAEAAGEVGGSVPVTEAEDDVENPFNAF